MKTVLASRTISVPEGVEIEIKAREVTVKGPRGTLFKSFKHINMDLKKLVGEDGQVTIRLDVWFASRKQLACVRTIMSHIDNMFIGVTRGFMYKMRFVYSHFPINVAITGSTVEIRNFLGEKRVRKVQLCEGVEYVRSTSVKDQIELSGNDLSLVSLSAAKIQQATNIRKKDLRKFLDGIYVSEKGPIPEPEE
eukprot:CAMPEP_0182462392 /NCGR_PEP_ID=MMETSP1319-20130603/6673_1 /TAXON_ID=172717 /ORGANISM="Bolidomonas pacifica, Strain RCC208" /LENGTH=192 /DNA_ID=CAMNT_0024661819 /DNA_START=57 /DNA_END=635 /DNA_ORIENTATION=+